MPKNIVDAYRNAVNGSDDANFSEVIAFCENDKKCQDDNSLKKNTLMYWSYKKIAMFYEKNKRYKQAYLFWQKAFDFANTSDIRIKIGYKMLDAVNNIKTSMSEKAADIVKIATGMQKEYNLQGNEEKSLQMLKLQKTAEKLLKKSKALH